MLALYRGSIFKWKNIKIESYDLCNRILEPIHLVHVVYINLLIIFSQMYRVKLANSELQHVSFFRVKQKRVNKYTMA